LRLKGQRVTNFTEKPQSGEGWINGGFFCFSNGIFKFLKNDQTVLEEDPLTKLTKKKNLFAFRHKSFWQCMDTKRDHDLLEEMWKRKKILWLKK